MYIEFCPLGDKYLLDLLLKPEDEGVIFLRNLHWLSPEYTTFYLRSIPFYDDSCENHISYIETGLYFVVDINFVQGEPL